MFPFWQTGSFRPLTNQRYPYKSFTRRYLYCDKGVFCFCSGKRVVQVFIQCRYKCITILEEITFNTLKFHAFPSNGSPVSENLQRWPRIILQVVHNDHMINPSPTLFHIVLIYQQKDLYQLTSKKTCTNLLAKRLF